MVKYDISQYLDITRELKVFMCERNFLNQGRARLADIFEKQKFCPHICNSSQAFRDASLTARSPGRGIDELGAVFRHAAHTLPAHGDTPRLQGPAGVYTHCTAKVNAFWAYVSPRSRDARRAKHEFPNLKWQILRVLPRSQLLLKSWVKISLSPTWNPCNP